MDMANFFRSVWVGEDDVVPFDLIVAVEHAGGYAAVARQGEQIVAASFGFRGSWNAKPTLHSHVTASKVPGGGFALKNHQREWASERDISAITWTFDPLVRRNCVFNFAKLGATAVEYLPNFYGQMTDVINRGDSSDRLLALWTVGIEDTVLASEAPVALANIAGLPVLQDFEASEPFLVQLPADIEGLRKSDLDLALQWRIAVRQLVLPAMIGGAIIRGMDESRSGFIVHPKQ